MFSGRHSFFREIGTADDADFLGSARAERAGDRALAIANFVLPRAPYIIGILVISKRDANIAPDRRNTYKIKPSKRTEFLEAFESKSVPEHQKIGMKILGPFLSVEDADTLSWMRAFPGSEGS
jgi:hypothetical protein